LKQSDRFNSHGWLIELTTYLSDDTINSQTRYIYNDLGRLIAEEFSKSHSSSYQYDDAGHLIRRNFLDSLGKIISSDSAKFDDLGRLQEKNESYFGSRTVYIYNQNGSLLKETLYSGFDTNNEIFITTYEYNSRGNKIKETRFDETTKKLIAITTYEYEYYGN
jgi:YD repeat-containing protein